MFDSIKQNIESLPKKYYEMGGHATVWAKRSQLEGCKVYTVTAPDEYSTKNIKVDSKEELLQIPDLSNLSSI